MCEPSRSQTQVWERICKEALDFRPVRKGFVDNWQ